MPYAALKGRSSTVHPLRGLKGRSSTVMDTFASFSIASQWAAFLHRFAANLVVLLKACLSR
jgi:hypothetical protein